MVCNQCTDKVNSNQIKLEQCCHNSEMPDMNIQIKQEPVDESPVQVNVDSYNDEPLKESNDLSPYSTPQSNEDGEVYLNMEIKQEPVDESPVQVNTEIYNDEPVQNNYNDLPPPLTPQGSEDGEVYLNIEIKQEPVDESPVQVNVDSYNDEPLKESNDLSPYSTPQSNEDGEVYLNMEIKQEPVDESPVQVNTEIYNDEPVQKDYNDLPPPLAPQGSEDGEVYLNIEIKQEPVDESPVQVNVDSYNDEPVKESNDLSPYSTPQSNEDGEVYLNMKIKQEPVDESPVQVNTEIYNDEPVQNDYNDLPPPLTLQGSEDGEVYLNMEIKQEPVDESPVQVNTEIYNDEPVQKDYNDLPPPLTPQGSEDAEVYLNIEIKQEPVDESPVQVKVDSYNDEPVKESNDLSPYSTPQSNEDGEAYLNMEIKQEPVGESPVQVNTEIYNDEPVQNDYNDLPPPLTPQGSEDGEVYLNIEIKQEPVDGSPVQVNTETYNDEPVKEDYNDLPPPLTPQGSEDREVEMLGENSGVLLDLLNDGENNSRKRNMCGNIRKNEKIIHVFHRNSVSDDGSLSLDNRPWSSLDSQSLAELSANQNKEPNSEDTPPISLENLSKTELSYIEKCKAMAQMYTSLECACHKVRHSSLKGLLTHLRSSRIWFPAYTCCHCMISFSDKYSSDRHNLRCTRGNLETLVKLSNLSKRSKVKTRLYQNYKCTKCKFMYSFHEDFCTHVDENHSDVVLPLRCECDRVFTTLKDFKDHAYVSCLVEFYCDICFVTVKTLDNFQKHAAEAHDSSAGFILLQDDNYKRKRSPSRSVTDAKRETYSKESISIENIIHGKRERGSSYYKQSIIDADDSESKLMKKVTGTACPVCDKTYSSNSNMLRHYRTHVLEAHDEDESTSDSYDDSVYCCPECGGLFSSVEWEQHKEMHPKKTCGECGKVFQFQTELDQHRNVHLSPKDDKNSKTQSCSRMSPNNEASILVMCEICDTMFISKEQLKHHKLTHETMPVLDASVEFDQEPYKKFSCKRCNKNYSSYDDLRKHNRKKHKFSQSQFPKQCQYCDKILKTGGSYYMHKKTHERKLKNESAVFKPTANSTMKEDDDNDNSESYHTCKRCFKVFSKRSSLRNHMKTHGMNYTSPNNKSGPKNKPVKKLLCDICHSLFDNSSSLEQHKNEEHAQTEDTRPSLSEEKADVEAQFVLTCDVCLQTFSSKLALKRHKEKHVQERMSLSNCKNCKTSFANLKELQTHMEQEHMPLKSQPKVEAQQFPCTLCRKVFSTAAAMHSHQGWHKRGRPLAVDNSFEPLLKKVTVERAEPGSSSFKCSVCTAVLHNDTALQIHILENHRIKCPQCNRVFEKQSSLHLHLKVHARQNGTYSVPKRPLLSCSI